MPAANLRQTIDKRQHCPFGCTLAQSDEHNYCCHLVGFTTRKQKYEPIVRLKDGKVQVRSVVIEQKPVRAPSRKVIGSDGKVTEVEGEVTDYEQVVKSALLPVQKGDVLVNPEYLQKDDMGTHMARKWSHFRVYRQCSEEEARKWRALHVAQIEETDNANELLEVA